MVAAESLGRPSRGRRPVATTWWPCASAWRAMSAPSPRPAPVTKMVLRHDSGACPFLRARS